MLSYPYTDLATSRRRDYERRAEHHRVLAALARADRAHSEVTPPK